MENITICECHLVPVMVLAFVLASLAETLMEAAAEKRWRRKALKFLSDEDIQLINYYLDGYYPTTPIGEVILNAYKRDMKLKAFRKQRWQKVKDFFKFKKGDK